MKILDFFFKKYNWYRRLFKNEMWVSKWVHKQQGGLTTFVRFSKLHNSSRSIPYSEFIKMSNIYDELIGKDIFDHNKILKCFDK